ncbi:MAG: hypothetical protein ACI4I4_01945 [Acutalibacteraceae bacterium]
MVVFFVGGFLILQRCCAPQGQYSKGFVPRKLLSVARLGDSGSLRNAEDKFKI